MLEILDKTYFAGRLAVAMTEIDRLRTALRAIANDQEANDEISSFARRTCKQSEAIIRR
jgi:hypothetical protein